MTRPRMRPRIPPQGANRVNPEILLADSDHYVRELADLASPLRDYLLWNGVPCAPLEQRWGRYQTFRLEKPADLQEVRPLLERWTKAGHVPFPVH